jgi:hypothetical protein
MSTCATRKRQCGGSTLIEATLIIMFLMTLLLSIINFGDILFQHETLLYQARRAARYGAVNPSNVAAVQNIVLYGQTSAPQERRPGMFGLTSEMVTVARNDAGTSEDRIRVQIQDYSYTLVLPFLAGSFKGKPIQVSLPVEQ